MSITEKKLTKDDNELVDKLVDLGHEVNNFIKGQPYYLYYRDS